MTSTPNQTTFGLAVKLHHQFGNSEQIKLLSDHGLTVSYYEVLRFRKSAAKYVSDNSEALQKAIGMNRTVGPDIWMV